MPAVLTLKVAAKSLMVIKPSTKAACLFTDNSIFDIFSYQFLYGDAKDALAKPQTIVLTKTLAENIFGDAAEALNKTVILGDQPATVTGVIADVPVNSHFTFKALRALPADYTAGYGGNWGNSNLYTYLLLKDHNDYKKIEAAGNNFFNKHIKNDLGAMKFTLQLQPLTDIHLHSNLSYELGANGNITYVYVFSITALLILFIAIINYVNLTTARSSIRIKEIGVRKVIGSDRTQLMIMFFAECILLTFISTALAAAIIKLVLPAFNQLSGKTLILLQFGTIKTVAAFIGFGLVAGILSGIYPALIPFGL
jgi:putative ABC transport system permease protein